MNEHLKNILSDLWQILILQITGLRNFGIMKPTKVFCLSKEASALPGLF